MAISERLVNKTSRELRSVLGPERNTAFAFLHLQQELGLTPEEALARLLIGGETLGITAYHYDRDSRNFHLLVYRWAMNLRALREGVDALIQSGFSTLFAPDTSVSTPIGVTRLVSALTGQSQLPANLSTLQATLAEHRDGVNRVIIDLVYNGDPQVAARSPVMPYLEEEVSARRFLVEAYFGRGVDLRVMVTSARLGRKQMHQTRAVRSYDLGMPDSLDWATPSGVHMRIGFVQLAALGRMYKDAGLSFFESNVRAGLAEDEAPNRAITTALKDIVSEGSVEPEVFAFNHNGVTLCVEAMTPNADGFTIVSPRLLNGAQTVSTFLRFMERQNVRFSNARLQKVKVLCKLIVSPDDAFTRQVTINNNRQNPVMPWNLRANDPIQLEIQEWLLESLGIYYERQENAFAALETLTPEELAERGILADGRIRIVKLAGTFLAIDGRIEKMARMKEVFEDDAIYNATFTRGRLNADPRALVVCYKIDRCIAKLLKELNAESASGRYAFLYKGRNLIWALLCQALLNDSDRLEDHLDAYGEDLIVQHRLRDAMATYARTRVRPVLNELVEEEPYADAMRLEKYDFLSSRKVYERAMSIAGERYGWRKRHLPAQTGVEPRA